MSYGRKPARLACLALMLTGCSRPSGSVPSPPREMSISEQSEIAKRYNPSSLIEVNKLSDFPSELRSHFKGWMEPGEEHGDAPNRLIIAGLSDSSALVAYEEFGYVPSTHAIAYVHSKGIWVAARTWDKVGYPTSLPELEDAIAKIEQPTSGR